MNRYHILVLIGILIGCNSDPNRVSSPIPIPNFQPITTVEFCPDIPPAIGFVESGLYINRILYAVYFDGSHTFLAEITQGHFVTTDGRNCHFSVNNNFNVSYP